MVKEKTKMIGVYFDQTTIEKLKFIQSTYHIRTYSEVIRFLVENNLSIDKYYEMALTRNNKEIR